MSDLLEGWRANKQREADAAAPPAAVATLMGIPERLKGVLLSYRKERLATAREPFINYAGMTDRNKASQDKALATIDAMQNEANDAKATIAKMVAAAFAGPTDNTARLLAIQESERCWRRLHSQIKTGADPIDLINQSAARASLIDLAALREELPYLLDPGMADAAMKLLDAVELPLLPDPQRKARMMQADVDANMPLVLQALLSARYEASGAGTVTMIPAWGKKVVQVTDELLAEIGQAEAAFLRNNLANEPGLSGQARRS